MTDPDRKPGEDRLAEAARRSLARDAAARNDPEPSLARRFGQIGILGWMIAGPMLLGVLGGHWLDRLLGTGITIAAALTLVGAGLGLWFAMRWMGDQ